jgi:ribonuclease-3
VAAARHQGAAALLKALELEPKDLQWYEQALVHRSLLNETGQDMASNERLEFLGDSVLGLIAARFLFQAFPDLSEGQLARRKSQLVSTTTLAQWSRAFHLGEYLQLGKGEEQTGGRDKDTLLADGFEGWLGAIYMDRGYAASEAFVFRFLKDQPAAMPAGRQADAKSRLQEWSQKVYKRPPLYRVSGTAGPDHQRQFEIDVVLEGQVVAKGRGKNKKEAEQAGAEEALKAVEGKKK